MGSYGYLDAMARSMQTSSFKALHVDISMLYVILYHGLVYNSTSRSTYAISCTRRVRLLAKLRMLDMVS
jgi:hypothetical protein